MSRNETQSEPKSETQSDTHRVRHIHPNNGFSDHWCGDDGSSTHIANQHSDVNAKRPGTTKEAKVRQWEQQCSTANRE